MRHAAWLALLAAAGAASVATEATRLRAAITDNLAVHLRLDGNTEDSSPRNNDAATGASALFYLPGANSDAVTRTPKIGAGALDLSFGDPLEYSAGVGLRYRLPFLSVGLDVAQSISETDRSPRFHINFTPEF